MANNDTLLEIEDATIKYRTKSGMMTAVSDASITINEGEYFGLVGESGSGKSTLAKSVIGGLDSNGSITSGKIKYKGTEIQNYNEKRMNKKIRWNEISFIPQSAMNALDPLRRIVQQAIEIGQVNTNLSNEELRNRFSEMFEIVGLNKNRISDYPHEFSGGMKQRVVIALALFLNPSLIIADEPTTALDVIMQDQIFKYLETIQETQETSLLLITHDISLVFEECDSLAVMHGSQVAETGTTQQIFNNPRHPYSILLQDAFPDIRYTDQRLRTIEGYPPQLLSEVDFCTFADRCPWTIEECKQHSPQLRQLDKSNESNHKAACFRMEEDLAADYEKKEVSQ